MATFSTQQTWSGHNATRYHNLNALVHALAYALTGFVLFAMRYHHALPSFFFFFFKYIYIYIINLTVALGNALQIATHHAKLKENVW